MAAHSSLHLFSTQRSFMQCLQYILFCWIMFTNIQKVYGEHRFCTVDTVYRKGNFQEEKFVSGPKLLVEIVIRRSSLHGFYFHKVPGSPYYPFGVLPLVKYHYSASIIQPKQLPCYDTSGLPALKS
ncbi:hypothetical protein HUJ04_005011 [Dendroctonus ponderosae]|nr:hypothetical protein HUJ04_005011 [Dendroctonus ponderosae]